MNKDIIYVGFYDFTDFRNNRYIALSAINKMDYICDAINRAGYNVHIISTSWVNNENFTAKLQWQHTHVLDHNKKLTLCPSFGSKYKILNYFKVLLSLAWLCIWLLNNAKKRDKILLYHSPILSIPIRFAKFFKGFKLILEIEEIYSKVWETSKIEQKWEHKLIRQSEAYIVVSENIENIPKDKEKIILYGSYHLPKIQAKIQNTNTYNLVYAGAIEFTRAGAFNAIQSLYYLPDTYILSILGSGDDESIKKLKVEINDINNRLGRLACVYHGIKTGKDFDNIMNTFDIGLNTQNIGDYMDTAFPSKILMYLSYNLRVVSTKIKNIESSKIASFINFSEDASPQAIANAITTINFQILNHSGEFISNLDRLFVTDLKKILSE